MIINLEYLALTTDFVLGIKHYLLCINIRCTPSLKIHQKVMFGVYFSELQIRRGNSNELGIVIHISPLKHIL